MKVKLLQNSISVPTSRISLWVPLLGVVVLLGLSPGRADAYPQFLPIVKTTYAVKTGGVIDAKRCGVCHADAAGGGAVNPYGKDVKTLLKTAATQTLTPELLHRLDERDSDGDGFANLDEFKADMLPGDAMSHPAKKPDLAVKSVKSEGEISPFDVKTALFARNAQHPVIVHFPIGLFIISVLFDVLGTWKKNASLRIAATYNLVVAAFGGLFAVISGLIAWQWQFGGAELRGNLQLHLILGIVTTGLLFLLWGFRSRLMKKSTVPLTRLYFLLSIISLALISLTGHIGGILSEVVKPLQ